MNTFVKKYIAAWYTGSVDVQTRTDAWPERATLCSEFEMSVCGFGSMGSSPAVSEGLTSNCYLGDKRQPRH